MVHEAMLAGSGPSLRPYGLRAHFTGCYVKPAEDRSGLGEFLEVTPVQT